MATASTTVPKTPAPALDAAALKEAFATVETLAARSTELATKIKAGVKGFERRLQSMKGRAPARVCQKHGNEVITLSFEPQGPEWKLVWSSRGSTGQVQDQQILLTMDVQHQMRAIKMLPALMADMVKSHERQIAELEPAVAAIRELGIESVGLYGDDGSM